MRFSTSTVLAAMAIYVGQTSADCSIYAPKDARDYVAVDCTPSQDKLSQNCDSIGASTTIFPGGFKVTSGNVDILLGVYCGPPQSSITNADAFCSPHSSGEFNFNCNKDTHLYVYRKLR
ncbi:hypothetical protein E4U53_000186 [Claviceps sorghi]|nr:hypothetical protein E4U53_000186 [Claviceps sorghi]